MGIWHYLYPKLKTFPLCQGSFSAEHPALVDYHHQYLINRLKSIPTQIFHQHLRRTEAHGMAGDRPSAHGLLRGTVVTVGVKAALPASRPAQQDPVCSRRCLPPALPELPAEEEHRVLHSADLHALHSHHHSLLGVLLDQLRRLRGQGGPGYVLF